MACLTNSSPGRGSVGVLEVPIEVSIEVPIDVSLEVPSEDPVELFEVPLGAPIGVPNQDTD